uniref:Uncharacterized protein n=1 Tax=Anguilla anguilla TaxID=7936 RepID=A0A0E9VGT9_ANGAN
MKTIHSFFILCQAAMQCKKYLSRNYFSLY